MEMAFGWFFINHEVDHVILHIPLLADRPIALDRNNLFGENFVVFNSHIRNRTGSLVLRIVLHVVVTVPFEPRREVSKPVLVLLQHLLSGDVNETSLPADFECLRQHMFEHMGFLLVEQGLFGVFDVAELVSLLPWLQTVLYDVWDLVSVLLAEQPLGIEK